MEVKNKKKTLFHLKTIIKRDLTALCDVRSLFQDIHDPVRGCHQTRFIQQIKIFFTIIKLHWILFHFRN